MIESTAKPPRIPQYNTGVAAGLSELEYYLITVQRTILRDFERDFGQRALDKRFQIEF